jgi:hypothetical protein
MQQYRVTKTLNKVYEVYVDAETKEEAERKGSGLLENGQGELVNDYYDEDETGVEELMEYTAERPVTLMLRRTGIMAADEDEAYEFAVKEFACAIQNLSNNVQYVTDVKVGDMELKED